MPCTSNSSGGLARMATGDAAADDPAAAIVVCTWRSGRLAQRRGQNKGRRSSGSGRARASCSCVGVAAADAESNRLFALLPFFIRQTGPSTGPISTDSAHLETQRNGQLNNSMMKP